MPEIEGLDKFKGLVIHSHDFKSAQTFEGLRVAVVGSSLSAEDITCQLYKYGAKHVTITHRKQIGGQWAKMGYKWPENVEERSLFVNANGKKLLFSDGTEVEVDAIILCTGYKHHFPFLERSLQLECKNLLWINCLKQGVVSPVNNKLYFMAMTNHFVTWQHFAAQAWYVRDCLLHRLDNSVPLKDESGQILTNDDF